MTLLLRKANLLQYFEERGPLMIGDEIYEENGNELPGYTKFAELRCTTCSKPHPKIKCPTIDVVSNVSYTCTNDRWFASTCSFTCTPGFIFTGAPVEVRCLSTGQWSVDPTTQRCQSPRAIPKDVYTRWGDTVCDKLDTKLYTGRAIGSPYHEGSGANRLCLAPAAATGRERGAACKETTGYGNGGWYHLGYTSTFEQCKQMVLDRRPDASGVNRYIYGGHCYAITNYYSPNGHPHYRTCSFFQVDRGSQARSVQ